MARRWPPCPRRKRAPWLALADGLGLDVPEPVWAELAQVGAAPAPTRRPTCCCGAGSSAPGCRTSAAACCSIRLLLLDGRPEGAAPVTLRRALDALSSLGLERDARALAAGTGGALGL